MTIGPGTLVNGKYRLGRLLGEGGMGSIFEARHEFLGTEVALKFLHPVLSSRPHVVARFVQEARVSANIKSPHVVSVIDVDQSPEGLAFLVMELLHGEPLSSRLAREPVLPLPLVVNIALQVLLALETAHAFGVVHRDMKPENVFLTDAPGNPGANSQGLLVKILDFGIAKLRTLGEVRAQLTRPGVVMGTPEYMSPEQVFAADAVDARADLYALGAMCFEMLAGQRPIQGDDPRALAAQVMGGMTPRLESIVPSVPVSIADVVAIALSAKPQDRFTSATAMRQALVHAAREAEVPLDAPQAALRTRTPSVSALSALDASSPNGVLGGVGLGVAPPAMLGPGNPAAMAAWDARQASGEAPVKHVSPSPSTNGSHDQLAALPPTPASPIPAKAPTPSPVEDRGGTLAAMPSPYAPPYGTPFGGDGAQGGEPAPITSPSGTDAGMLSPFATDPNFRPESIQQVISAESTSTEVPSAPSRGGAPWALIGLGVVLIAGLVALVVWAARPSTAPSPPPPVPTATASTEDDEPNTPKKKKPKPEPTATATATATTTTPTTTVPVTAKPKPTVSAKPSTSVSTIPTPSVSASVPKPPPTTSVPDIIPLPPLPWPPPGMP